MWLSVIRSLSSEDGRSDFTVNNAALSILRPLHVGELNITMGVLVCLSVRLSDPLHMRESTIPTPTLTLTLNQTLTRVRTRTATVGGVAYSGTG